MATTQSTLVRSRTAKIIIEAIGDEDFFLKPASDFDKSSLSFLQKLHKFQNSSTF